MSRGHSRKLAVIVGRETYIQTSSLPRLLPIDIASFVQGGGDHILVPFPETRNERGNGRGMICVVKTNPENTTHVFLLLCCVEGEPREHVRWVHLGLELQVLAPVHLSEPALGGRWGRKKVGLMDAPETERGCMFEG